MRSRQVKVALVGCGQIADAHLQEIRRTGCAEVVGVCDQHRDLAAQAAARFGVPGVFDDLNFMLSSARPEVVHVTTPPHTHHALALRILAAGAHVYLEKPFTVNTAEADEVLAAAQANQRLVCVGHDHLFDPAWEECRQLYRRGDLGQVVHVDAVQGYDLTGPFGKVMASEPGHWIHRLPGGLFHNTISHALYKILEFLPDEEPQVWATWFGSSGANGFPTELRVFLRGAGTTGNLISSSGARPVQRVTRVYGTRRSVEVDLDGRLLRRVWSPAMRGPFVKVELPWRHLVEGGRSFARNLWRFLSARLHFFSGMHRLFTLFYQAILQGGEPPIPYQDIRRVTAVMDQIFACCREESGRQSRRGERGGRNHFQERWASAAPLV
jgi:predicted dehydrogenase